jgi:hypothetical protein
MGMSKVILASGVFVIVGMYSLSFRAADNATSVVALAQAIHSQTEQIALAGTKFAAVDLGGSASIPTILPSGSVNLMGGTVSYRTDPLPSSKLKVTSVGTYGGHSVTYLATVEFVSPRWQVKRIYEVPDAAEFSRLN